VYKNNRTHCILDYEKVKQIITAKNMRQKGRIASNLFATWKIPAKVREIPLQCFDNLLTEEPK
jgi:hypothetical protein